MMQITTYMYKKIVNNWSMNKKNPGKEIEKNSPVQHNIEYTASSSQARYGLSTAFWRKIAMLW